MTSRIRQQQIGSILTIRNVWMEGKAPIPRNPVSIYETHINNLLGLFLGQGTSLLLGLERNATQPVVIVNKLSGKALEVENSSVNQGARIQQGTWNDSPNQRWFVRRARSSKHMSIPASIRVKCIDFGRLFFRFQRQPIQSLLIIVGYVWTSWPAQWTVRRPYKALAKRREQSTMGVRAR